jgi:carbamate kinase
MRDDPEPADLDVRVAQTQGELGYLLIASLTDALGEPCVGVLTRVVVDPADTAFDAPSKPVGALLAARPPSGSAVAVSGGFRRVVASPRPLQVVEQSAIATLLASHHVVAGGGGGIPVAPGAASIAGVIDKDFVAALLAIAFDAHQLVFATNVPGVLDDFGTAAARLQATLRIDEASALLRAGRLAPGSMAPKVESAAQFAASTGRAALIVHTDDLSRVLEQPSPGTILLPD